ncbi:uncharacterized protein LOC129005865 [Macrosteles quadrilineatus]|uniref:uncharacterized protein LOC129001143 n=1 Tax=Macrosteles quadrilineatus TaxID=74068 RepID=UPI0023E27CDE|nr:uncharacterized protein LOC129001143 [Macrosteles quadrilineatus]XP_054290868.1 uncharacterized protein LOC129005865 [Macrosteles quadrilineatus]
MAKKRELDEQKLREEIERITKNDKSVCKSGGKTYKVGETWRDKGKCEVRACHPGGLISVMPCPRFIYDKKKPRPDCATVPGDTTLEYPDCCEYVYCKPKIDKPG